LFGFFYAPEIIALATSELPGTAVAVAIGVGFADTQRKCSMSLEWDLRFVARPSRPSP
jgi:hypothetical protein